MALVVPNVAEDYMLQLILKNEDALLGLYTNDVTPAETDVLGTFVEMNTQNYATKTLAGSGWGIVQGAPTLASYALQTWTFAAGGPTACYGYFVRRNTNLLYGERFTNGPYIVQNAGDQVKVTPHFSLE